MIMKKIIFSFSIFCLIMPGIIHAGIVIGPPPVCPSVNKASVDGNTFNFKSYQYDNGYLDIKYQYNRPSGPYNPAPAMFRLEASLKNGVNCSYAGSGSLLGDYYPDIASGDYSIRFQNNNDYAIFNDTNNQPVICDGCSGHFTANIQPPYKVSFSFYANVSIDSTTVVTDTMFLDNFNIYNTQPKKSPVLIIPGLLGTELKKDNTILWASVFRMVDPLNLDSFMDPLQFNKDLTPSDPGVYASKIIDNPDGRYNYSEGLILALQDQGYTQGASPDDNLFLFPYDWRYGISESITSTTSTEDLLKKKIDDIIAQTGASKVDVIAHSTGGLLLKKYVQDNPNAHHVGKAIMLGVPNLGAPQAIKVLLQGDNFGVPGLEDLEMQKISKNFPVTYDLSPTQKYVDINGSYIKIVTASGFSSNTVNLDFAATDSFLTNDHNLNAQAVIKSNSLHNTDFDNFDLREEGVDLYSIVGCKSGTIGKITEYRNQGQVLTSVAGYSTDDVSGDGTVPMTSANSIATDNDHKFYAIKADHGRMPSADGIRQEIINILTGSVLDTGSSIITEQTLVNDPTKCKLKGHWWQIFSPLSIQVIDQDGRIAGVAVDGSVQNNIPGADYEVIGEHKFVFVPTDENQTYSVSLKGMGTGTFTFKDQNIDNNQVTQTQIFSNIPVTTSLTGTVNLGSATTLSLDTNGDGTTDQTIQPSAILNQDQSQDLAPPISTSTLTGIIGQPGFYRSDVKVSLSAIDPVIPGQESQTSGVLKTQVSVDGGEYVACLPPPLPSPQGGGNGCKLTITSEGQHIISFFSTDKAGNNEQEQTISFTIDKTPPEFVIQYNPLVQDLDFTATDTTITQLATTTLSSKGFPVRKIKLIDNDDIITATDQAGNTAQIKLKDKSRKKNLKAEIKSIIYNDQPADISKNNLSFNWQLDKSGNLKALDQQVRSRKDFNLEASFKNNQTVVSGKDQSGKIKKTLNGLVLLKVTTDKGDLEWGLGL